MKKSIVALAVSSAALASAYAAEKPDVGFYGSIRYAYTDQDNGFGFDDNGSTIGFKGESRVTDDITSLFKYELKFKADENDVRSIRYGLGQAYAGLRGSFGQITLGTHSTIYEDSIQDSMNQMKSLSVGYQPSGTTQGDTLTYSSPSMNGLEVQVAAQVKGRADLGPSTPSNGGSIAEMAVLKYSTDAFSIALGHDTRKNTSDGKPSTGLAVTINPMDRLSASFKYETAEDTADYLGIAFHYSYSMGDAYASITSKKPTGGSDDSYYNSYVGGLTYSINNAMYTYVELGSYEDKVSSSIGMTYLF